MLPTSVSTGLEPRSRTATQRPGWQSVGSIMDIDRDASISLLRGLTCFWGGLLAPSWPKFSTRITGPTTGGCFPSPVSRCGVR